MPLTFLLNSEKDFENAVQLYNFKLFQCQSFHSLLQALHIALNNSLTSIVRDTAYRMLDCVGRYDARVAVQLLALYQVRFMPMVLHFSRVNNTHVPFISN